MSALAQLDHEDEAVSGRRPKCSSELGTVLEDLSGRAARMGAIASSALLDAYAERVRTRSARAPLALSELREIGARLACTEGEIGVLWSEVIARCEPPAK